MKTLKFQQKLVPLIKSGQKTVTFRLFDDKDLLVGDVVTLFETETGYQFGVMTITGVRTKTLGNLAEDDWVGHERYNSNDEMYDQFRSFYGESVKPDTEVKIISFDFEAKLYKKCVVVDENDHVIGAEYIAFAIQKGLIRRASRVFVFNQTGQLLVQRRSQYVLKPLLLDQSAAGHVDEGDSYQEAAERELSEELGLTTFPLTEIAVSVRTEKFFSAVYRTIVPDNVVINFDPEEVDSVIWYDIPTLNSEMATKPENFTPEFKEVWELLQTKIVPLKK